MIEQIKTETKADWLALRKSGIGGSDIGAIMGLSRFRTAYDVYLEKTGQKAPDPDNNAIHWGNVLEDVVAKEYQGRTGRKVQRINQMMRHPDYDFVIGNIDRAVVNPDIMGNVRWKDGRLTTDRILECKTANGFTAKLWGDAGTDYVPDAYLTQVQWYMLLTGCQYADLAVLIGGQDYRIYNINRDDDLITYMLEYARTFWNNTVKGIPPTPTTAAEAGHKFANAAAGKAVELDTSFSSEFQRLKQIKEETKALADEEDSIKARIMSAMADAETATLDGITVCTWKGSTTNRFDSKAFKEAQPDLYKQYTKATTGRRFLVK